MFCVLSALMPCSREHVFVVPFLESICDFLSAGPRQTDRQREMKLPSLSLKRAFQCARQREARRSRWMDVTHAPDSKEEGWRSALTDVDLEPGNDHTKAIVNNTSPKRSCLGPQFHPPSTHPNITFMSVLRIMIFWQKMFKTRTDLSWK